MKQKKDFSQLKKSKTKGEENKEKGLVRLMKLMVMLDQGALNLDKASEELGVSRRTLLRDVKILQDAGVPIFKPTEQGANYRLQEGYSLPHFQVTKENALNFADTLLAMQKFAKKPFKMVSTIQKPALESGKKEQKKRKEKRTKEEYNLAPTNLTEEQFLSAWLADQNIKDLPYETIILTNKVSKLFENEGRNKWYKDWQMKQAERDIIHLNFVGQRYKDVLDDCKRIIKREPKDTWAYKYAALACYARKDVKSALLYLLNSLDYNKKDDEVYTYIAFFSLQRKDYKNAISFFYFACRNQIRSAQFASYIYADAGLFDKALNEIDKAAQKDPEHKDIYAEMKEDVLKKKNEKKEEEK